MTVPTPTELEGLRQRAGIPNLPTPLTYAMRMAVTGEGDRAFDWEDKPHRLVYDLCREVEAQVVHIKELSEALKPFAEAGRNYLGPPDEVILRLLNGKKVRVSDLRRAALTLNRSENDAKSG